ncbi:TetR/AcrR family transcriptional regulator [Rugosimonospora africana]|uniref:HTH tetR-type domain-containing protein n=1 Tax=Rugosimonospora africana TaxID=556532 RepID=A0A8J3QYH3_9ACTN|nr:TetR/AcrR family transcriptional regulator [Rugosimonospora africana]GIH16986.1 hypothetical protein Raf01_51580 [Rugosimonospora africana]
MPSVTRRRSPDPARRASVEAQILAATERLLRDGASFTDLGVQRIAAEAGVARSTFYTHFSDKSQLLMRLANTMQTTAFDLVVRWQPTGQPDDPQRLIDVFREVIKLYRQHAEVLKAVNEVSSYDATVRQFWSSRLDRFLNRTAEVLVAEQEAGRTRADIDAATAARLIVLGGDRFLAHHVATDDGSGDEAAARELALTWWHGVHRRPA